MSNARIEKPVPDQILYLKGLWYCLVDMHLYGAWDNKAAAEAGLKRHVAARKEDRVEP